MEHRKNDRNVNTCNHYTLLVHTSLHHQVVVHLPVDPVVSSFLSELISSPKSAFDELAVWMGTLAPISEALLPPIYWRFYRFGCSIRRIPYPRVCFYLFVMAGKDRAAMQLPKNSLWLPLGVGAVAVAALVCECSVPPSSVASGSGYELRLILPSLTWRVGGIVTVLLWALQRLASRPVELRSQRSFDNTSARYRAKRRAAFPPPYPNGWFRVCSSADIADGRVHSVSALGTELVCFRDGEGHAAVLYAFCPHMGAHLGEGGLVNADGCLQCPFHDWTFDRTGKVTSIPYCTSKKGVPERAKTQAFETKEYLGMVFLWFDAEGRQPAWCLEQHVELEQGIADGTWYYGGMRQMSFEQHVCEMHMNSADAYHFQTLHGPIPVWGLGWLIKCTHEVSTQYSQPKAHLNTFHEKMVSLHVDLSALGLPWIRFPVPFARATASTIDTTVIFEGPAIMQFKIDTPLGSIRQVKTLLPVAPFTMQVEARWFAQTSMPRFLLSLMSSVGAAALNQDRQVWENKTYHKKPMLVTGDGCFPAFFRWYKQFYSESSDLLDAGPRIAPLEVGSAAVRQTANISGTEADVCERDQCAGLSDTCTSDGNYRAHIVRRGANGSFLNW